MRSSTLFAAAAGAVILGSKAPARAAAPKKQCITAAETGQQLRSSGRLIEARRALAACSASACPALVRKDCGRWIEEIDAAQPSVTVKLEDGSGADVSDQRVLLDGEPMLRGADGRATPLNPGLHKFTWAREAGRDIEESVVIREGERNRVILLRVPSSHPPARPTDPEGPPPPPPPARGPLPFVVGGLGLALAATGGIFWGIGLHDRSGLSTSCAAAHACAQNEVDASRTKLIVGDVLIGVGVLAVAGAVFLFLNQSGGDAGARAVNSGIPGARPFVVRVAAPSGL